jgi:hypothetical protein
VCDCRLLRISSGPNLLSVIKMHRKTISYFCLLLFLVEYNKIDAPQSSHFLFNNSFCRVYVSVLQYRSVHYSLPIFLKKNSTKCLCVVFFVYKSKYFCMKWCNNYIKSKWLIHLNIFTAIIRLIWWKGVELLESRKKEGYQWIGMLSKKVR